MPFDIAIIIEFFIFTFLPIPVIMCDCVSFSSSRALEPHSDSLPPSPTVLRYRLLQLNFLSSFAYEKKRIRRVIGEAIEEMGEVGIVTPAAKTNALSRRVEEGEGEQRLRKPAVHNKGRGACNRHCNDSSGSAVPF